MVIMHIRHNQAISSLILAGNDIRAISYSSVIASILGLITAWYLIPHYQIGGVCIAFVIYMIVQMIFYYCYYWPIKMNINSRVVFFKSFIPFTILGYISYYIVTILFNYISMSEIACLILKGFIFSFLYLISICFLINQNDKKFIISIIKKK